MFRHIALIRSVLSVGMVAVLGASALAQTRTYNSVRRFSTGPVQVSSTFDFNPQIGLGLPFNPHIAAENDGPPVRGNPGPTNNLRAGGFLSTTRGSGRSLFPGPVDTRGWEPQDNQMAVGPTAIICIINSQITFYSKTGTKTFEQYIDTPSGFFGSVEQSGFVFDPKAFFDPVTQRFFVLADDGASGSQNNILIAVSATSNPNGTWYKYRFTSAYNGSWLDFPGFGFNKDAVVVTGNLFDGNGSGVEAIVINKAPLLNGGNATATVFNVPTSFTLQPARTVDPSVDKIYGAASIFPAGNILQVFAFVNLTGAPAMREVDLNVPSYASPSNAANSMGNALSPDDDRLLVAQFRNGQIVTSHTIDHNGNCAGRWYDINVNSWPASGAPSLKQSGTISQANTDIFYPAVNINHFEDISVFYTRSSANIASDLCYSARTVSDPLGQIGQPVRMYGTNQSGYSGRWGDYLANEIDPNDDFTFWGFSMATAANNWFQGQILTWTVTVGTVGNIVTPDPGSTSVYLGTYIIGDETSMAASDGLSYQVGSQGIAQFGQAAGIHTSFTVPTDTSHMSVQMVTTAGVAGGTNMLWLYNWNTTNWDLVGSAPIAAAGTTQRAVAIPDSRVTNYVGPNGSVLAQLRGHFPIRPFNNQMPSPFVYHIDLLQLTVR